MTWDAVDSSIQDAVAVELYDFVTPTQTWRVTTYENDLTFGGNVYTAVLSGSDAINLVNSATDQSAVAIELPATHAICQGYVNGVPPASLLCTVRRYFPVQGLALQIWQGYASSIAFAGDTAKLRVPNGTADALSQDCPSVTASRRCPHFVFDEGCTLSTSGSAFSVPFSVSKTISSISGDGKTLVVNSVVPSGNGDENGNTVPWSLHGMLQHVATGAQRTIIGEAADGKTLTLMTQFPNGAINVGDAVTVVAGCRGAILTCANKFNNVINFGGHPNLPPTNIFYVGLVGARYSS